MDGRYFDLSMNILKEISKDFDWETLRTNKNIYKCQENPIRFMAAEWMEGGTKLWDLKKKYQKIRKEVWKENSFTNIQQPETIQLLKFYKEYLCIAVAIFGVWKTFSCLYLPRLTGLHSSAHLRKFAKLKTLNCH